MSTDMHLDLRDEAAIRARRHAVAHLRGYDRVVRGVERYLCLPTREPAAEVWVSAPHGMGGHHTAVAPLDDITIRCGAGE